MTFTRKNKNVCSGATTVVLAEDGTIETVTVSDGCDGNLKGLCQLLQGMPALAAIKQLKGITCDNKSTSCPDQIAICLQQALETTNFPSIKKAAGQRASRIKHAGRKS